MKKILTIAVASFVCLGLFAMAQEDPDKDTADVEFSKLTIDLGVVVSDLDAALKFYTQAIGFQDAGGFEVAADFAQHSGLTNGKALDIKVLKLGDGPGATSLKLMQVEGESAKADHSFIDSTLGVSYLTIFVADMNVAVKRLEKMGIEPIANGPAMIPDTEMALTLVRDPDGNLVELVGPMP